MHAIKLEAYWPERAFAWFKIIDRFVILMSTSRTHKADDGFEYIF